jgi:HlyD family secretion protein
MSCDADIKTETRKEVISVPIQSVTARIPKKEDVIEEENGDSTNNAEVRKEKLKPVEVVFVEDGNFSKMVEVETGISDDTYMEIKSGLEKGQKVISGPYKAISKELEDSTKVKISNKRDGKNSEDEE